MGWIETKSPTSIGIVIGRQLAYRRFLVANDLQARFISQGTICATGGFMRFGATGNIVTTICRTEVRFASFLFRFEEPLPVAVNGARLRSLPR